MYPTEDVSPIPRSGNPGYDTGKPLVGVSVDSVSAQLVYNEGQQLFYFVPGNRFHFGLFEEFCGVIISC